MSDRFSRLLVIALTAAIAFVIALNTLSPPSDGSPLPLTDKQLHALAFALLVLPSGLIHPRRWPLLALAAIAFGAAIELLQPGVGRSAEWADLAADAIGIAMGLLPGQIRRVTP